MALVNSLLTAIVRADGDALVMHVGEKPYVVTSSGPVELSTSGLNFEAMSGMVTQLLPADAIRALAEFGAVEHELQGLADVRDRFTVVVARGGEDVWIEIRRCRAPAPVGTAGVATPPASARVEPPASYGAASSVAPVTPVAPEYRTEPVAPIAPVAVEYREATSPPPAPEPVAAAPPAPVTVTRSVEPAPAVIAQAPVEEPAPVIATEEEIYELQASDAQEEPAAFYAEASSASARIDTPASVSETSPVAPIAPIAPAAPEVSAPVAPGYPPSPAQVSGAGFGEASRTEPVAPIAPVAPASAPAEPPSYGAASPEVRGPVVVPMTRTLRIEVPPRQISGRPAGIERLLSIAAARGASVLYLTSQSLPFVKVDGEIRALDGETPLASPDVEAAVLELMPENAREAHGRGEPAEWVSEFEGIGRIRCTTFRDYRGAGALFHMISARPVSAEQLGLAREIQALAMESDGLVLVASPRGGGKSTLLAAMVDHINRHQGGYVITLERQIRIVHDNRQSLVSQREVRGTATEVVPIARAALRENPDVLVIEDHNAPEVIQLALDAAGSGQLVFLSVTAGSTTSALMRLIDLFPPDRRKTVQAVLAERLRGAVAQVLLKKTGGGRLAARELLLTTSAVESLIAEGQLAQLAVAMDSGRKHGMVPLNDALRALVQSGAVEVREAYRKADDRAALLALLKRDGVDTSFAERLA